jgi:hypothetical protein
MSQRVKTVASPRECVGELANLAREKMRKRRQSPTFVSRIAPCKNDHFSQWSKYYSDDAQNITVMIKILLSRSSEYYSDDAQNITVMIKILLSRSSEYYSYDGPDITSTNWGYEKVGKKGSKR